jgi:hypothetical protein
MATMARMAGPVLQYVPEYAFQWHIQSLNTGLRGNNILRLASMSMFPLIVLDGCPIPFPLARVVARSTTLKVRDHIDPLR